MSNRTSLLRMIILVTFLILVLVIVSTRKASRGTIFTNPNFRETFFWQDKNKAFTLLLHSIIVYDSSFSAYSLSRDSIITFLASPPEIYSIKKKLINSSFSPQECLNCHEGKIR